MSRHSFSSREEQVMMGKALGMSHQEIADQLELSSSTVAEYWRRCRRKRELAEELLELFECR